MKEALWKIVGGDPFILKQSGKQSQVMFFNLGILYVILSVLTFISFLGLFYGIFNGFLQALFGSIVLTFILQNMYRLILITLEPSTLPISKEDKMNFWSYLVRVIVVIFISLFASKCIETMFFGHWVDPIIEGQLSKGLGGVRSFNTSSYFVKHLIELNKHYPQINIITMSFLTLYLAPVIIKHRLKKGDEYYIYRRKIDKQLVQNHYNKFRKYHSSRIESLYKRRKEIDIENNQLRVRRDSRYYKYTYKPKFYDEPFNTQPITETVDFGTTQDFLDLF